MNWWVQFRNMCCEEIVQCVTIPTKQSYNLLRECVFMALKFVISDSGGACCLWRFTCLCLRTTWTYVSAEMCSQDMRACLGASPILDKGIRKGRLGGVTVVDAHAKSRKFWRPRPLSVLTGPRASFINIPPTNVKSRGFYFILHMRILRLRLINLPKFTHKLPQMIPEQVLRVCTADSYEAALSLEGDL